MLYRRHYSPAVQLPTADDDLEHVRAAYSAVSEGLRELVQIRLNGKLTRVVRGLYQIEDILWQECKEREVTK